MAKSSNYPPIIGELPRVGLERLASILTKHFDEARVKDTIKLCVDTVEATKKGLDPPRRMLSLLKRWEDTRDNGNPDYEVYATREYLADIWACWLIFSRTYLKTMWLKPWPAHLKALWDEQETILDVGCGMGLSALGLSQMYPDKVVAATNMSDTVQWDVCKAVLGQDITLTETAEGHHDILFASEYFEHFEDPLDHLHDLLDEVTPNILVVANSFGTQAIGHFETHRPNGMNGKSAAKQFTKLLRKRGYRMAETKWWNNRPQMWTAE